MMRERGWYPVFYMFAVTAGFSSVVIGFSALTRERVEANARLAFEAAVLEALPGSYEPGLSGAEIHRRFTEQIGEPDASSRGAYVLKKDGQVAAYALPFEGQGFWARIRGILGIAADRKTVTGITFFEQSETPGLGAEIVKPAFRNQFKDKVLAPKERPITMRRPGATLGPSDVHAVTGATQTSVRVEEMINRAVKTWQGGANATDGVGESQSQVGKEGGAS